MSEDQERNQQEEHWRELAQLLGIDAEPKPVSKPATAKTPAPPVEVKAPPPPPEPVPVRPVAESHEAVLPSPVPEETVESPWEEPPPVEEPAAEVAEVRREEDRPRRGRRRKGRREDRLPPPRAEEEPPDLDAVEFPEESDNGMDESEDAPEPVEAQTEEDVDEENTLRDWNVPSWNELIASLYRPDR